ncbi:MAG: hypothetical protein OEZ01_06400 [Candidatus Heimdallarchaeota archaeon]|nr:hypothetical protein [Candidatus Heimdallarchaeota archaeon]MDH5645619.1 hypothetical protein [Candidatus Heimdallarchaeota archaeon]
MKVYVPEHLSKLIEIFSSQIDLPNDTRKRFALEYLILSQFPFFQPEDLLRSPTSDIKGEIIELNQSQIIKLVSETNGNVNFIINSLLTRIYHLYEKIQEIQFVEMGL